MNTRIRSVLIANRGEIAVRIIRACREMGIRTVAIYSEADRSAPHVLTADEAYPVGPAPSSESYLRMEAIIEVAKRADCDAIHPGYGFLSENAEFNRAVTNAGLTFIGPTADAIKIMGDKTSARTLMIERGVPVVPGTERAVTSGEEARSIALKVGYPILLKAAAGGGGKGMRVVTEETQLLKALESAQNEARSAFGDERVYIEKYVLEPRHVEIQVLADAHGNCIHLGERECSIQRRHQKVVEEAPSVIVDEELRTRMGQAAVEAARACGYVNAGTIEFLVDNHRNFYFLEMNTRLQVEHPVTEMVTGVDLVKMQIRVAEGHVLPMKQEDIRFRGHAIECRICAEDVRNDFLPDTGTILRYRPPFGFAVRDDSGVTEGSEISIHYDPMFAKLVVWGMDREDAIRKMRRALDEFVIDGVETTIPFCRFVMDHPAFIKGDFRIDFVEKHYQPGFLRKPQADESRAAALAAVLTEMDRTTGSALSSNGKGTHDHRCSPWLLLHRQGGTR
ncbi:MAG: acetyl-CoA carboxylase biotin carboxylase subunit [Bacteroidetes bacterium]|nr:acetyl-CoA carboxylase biotin carboxylase subunit [Bacteroidota bacterium]